MAPAAKQGRCASVRFCFWSGRWPVLLAATGSDSKNDRPHVLARLKHRRIRETSVGAVGTNARVTTPIRRDALRSVFCGASSAARIQKHVIRCVERRS